VDEAWSCGGGEKSRKLLACRLNDSGYRGLYDVKIYNSEPGEMEK
jgi:hypothetical protein